MTRMADSAARRPSMLPCAARRLDDTAPRARLLCVRCLHNAAHGSTHMPGRSTAQRDRARRPTSGRESRLEGPGAMRARARRIPGRRRWCGGAQQRAAARGWRAPSDAGRTDSSRSEEEMATNMSIGRPQSGVGSTCAEGAWGGEHEWWGDMWRAVGAGRVRGSAPMLAMREPQAARAARAPGRDRGMHGRGPSSRRRAREHRELGLDRVGRDVHAVEDVDLHLCLTLRTRVPGVQGQHAKRGAW